MMSHVRFPRFIHTAANKFDFLTLSKSQELNINKNNNEPKILFPDESTYSGGGFQKILSLETKDNVKWFMEREISGTWH